MARKTEDKCHKCSSPDIMPRKSIKYGKTCLPCHRTYTAKWRENNPEKRGASNRFRLTGCTHEQYTKLKLEQLGCCKICNKHESEFKIGLAADHCHKTGTVRGLLCSSCNRALGLFKDSPDLLISAIRYLSQP